MGLEGLLRKSLGTAVLAGALVFNGGCRELDRALFGTRKMDEFSYSRRDLPVTDRRSRKEITDCAVLVSGGKFNQNRDIGNFDLRGIVECNYNVKNYEEWTERVAFEEYYLGSLENEKTVIRESKQRKELGSEQLKFIPSNVSLSLEGFPEKVAVDVNSDGSFNGRIFNAAFKRPDEVRYYTIGNKLHNLVIDEADSSGKKPDGRTFNSALIGGPVSFFYKINDSEVKSYINSKINSKIFTITINAKDRNTRTSVGLQSMVVKRESLPPKIDEIVKSEFGDDQNLIRLAKSYIEYDPEKDSKSTGSGQSLTFNAFEGMKYSVETIDPAYHYTNSSFVADRKSPNKAVLLVEVGQKLRIDDTKEGKGDIIDDK